MDEDENKVDVDTSIDEDTIEIDLEDNEDEKTDREKKLEEIARNQKIRAEKAEKEAKEAKELLKNSSKSESKDESLSTGDLYALMSSKVPEEDVEEVVRVAKILGKSVKEALKDEAVSAILKTRQSYRDTANAANKGASRPNSKKVSSDDILKNASKGIFPEKGSTEADELFWARRGGKR